jgi:hypothetical protein
MSHNSQNHLINQVESASKRTYNPCSHKHGQHHQPFGRHAESKINSCSPDRTKKRKILKHCNKQN